jgi:hypothetical protein
MLKSEGLLFITFLVFTITITSNRMLALNTPHKTNDTGPIMKYWNTLTLIIGKDNQIF